MFPIRFNPSRCFCLCLALVSLATPLAAQDAASPAAPLAQAASTTAAKPAPGKAHLNVRQKGQGSPLGRVEVKAGNESHFTGPDGKVTVPLKAGIAIISLYRAGFEKLELPVNAAQEEEITVFLVPALAPEDNVITVRGERKPEVSRKVISAAESRKIAPGGDPAQVTKLLPGVTTGPFTSQLIVRGSGPEDSLYYYDAVNVPFLYHPIGDISILPPGLLEDVEFYTGGFGPQYGGATGGIVILRTKTEPAERPFTEIWANIPIYSGIYHERPLGGGSGEEKTGDGSAEGKQGTTNAASRQSISMSLRRSTLELIIPMILADMDDDAGRTTILPTFGDAHIQWLSKEDYGYNKVLAVYAYDGFHLAAPSDMAQDADGSVKFDFLSESAGLTFETKRRLNRIVTAEVSPTLVYANQDADFLGNKFSIRSKGIQLPTTVTFRLGKEDRVLAGTQIDYGIVDVNFLLPRFERDDPFFDFEEAPKLELKDSITYYQAAFWTLYEKKIGAWTLSPGVRLYHDPQIKESGSDPRFNVRYDLSETHAVKGSAGQYSKSPAPDQSAEVFGNPDLDFERSNHYVAGWEGKWSEFWETDLQVYRKDFYDMIRDDPTGKLTNSGTKVSTGFEAFIRRNLSSRLFGWVSYSFSETKEQVNQQTPWRISEFDQTHILQTVGSYRLSNTWELAGRYSYQTGKPYTPVTGAVYNANLDKYQPRSDTELFSRRLPAKHTLALAATKEFFLDTWTLYCRFGVENMRLGDRTEQIGYNYDYSRSENTETLPAIPFIELRATL